MHNISKLYFFIVFLVVEATLGSPFFLVTPPNVRRGSLSMMFYKMPLHLSWGMQDFMFYVKTFMFFRHLPFRLCVNKLTLWFSMDGVSMLLDVITVYTIWTNLVLQITLSCGVAWQLWFGLKMAFIDQYIANIFFLLAIKVIGCVH